MTIVYALKLAKQYCEFNGLDFNKLEKMKYFHFYDRRIDEFAFVAPLTEEQLKYCDPKYGLLYDRLTQPYPLLVVYDDGTVEETEYTREYLSK